MYDLCIQSCLSYQVCIGVVHMYSVPGSHLHLLRVSYLLFFCTSYPSSLLTASLFLSCFCLLVFLFVYGLLVAMFRFSLFYSDCLSFVPYVSSNDLSMYFCLRCFFLRHIIYLFVVCCLFRPFLFL